MYTTSHAVVVRDSPQGIIASLIIKGIGFLGGGGGGGYYCVDNS